MSPRRTTVPPKDRRDERRLIDEEIAVIALTWEDQQRLRGRILGRLHAIAQRFSSGDAQDPDAQPEAHPGEQRAA
jgi:hypothetical protein